MSVPNLFRMQSVRIILPLSLVFVFANLATSQDKIYQLSGTTLTGEMESTSPNELVINVRGKSQTVAINTVQRVAFDGEPNNLANAKEMCFQKQWDQADEELKRVDANALKTESAKQDFAYYQSLVSAQLALAGRGNSSAAAAAMLGFVRSNPKTYHFYELCEVVGGLATAINSYPDAIKYYGAIGNAPFPEYKLRSIYLIGTVLLIEGKADEAKAEFEKVKTATATDSASQRYQKLASIASIRCDIVKGDPKSAVDKLLKLVSESDSTDATLFSNIYNTLGDAHLALGQLEEAKLSFLRTDLLFASDSENHAEALYQLAKLWEKTGDPQRAIDAKTRLKERYAASRWASK